MSRFRYISGRIPFLVLALLLHSALTTAQLHAYEHDPAAPASSSCNACISAGQLLSVGVDSVMDTSLAPAAPRQGRLAMHASGTNPTLVIRQRGPPATA